MNEMNMLDEAAIRDIYAGIMEKLAQGLSITPEEGKIVHSIHLHDQKKMEGLEKLCTQDSTLLWNKVGFRNKLEEALTLAKNPDYKSDTLLLVIDADRFKRYNDRYGHVKGDHLIQHIADYLKTSFQLGDIVGRYGGDEFTIIAPRFYVRENNLGNHPLSKRLNELLEEYNKSRERIDPSHIVTLSIGATFLQPSWTADEAIENTDDAMYHAKLLGNSWQMWNPEVNYEQIHKEIDNRRKES